MGYTSDDFTFNAPTATILIEANSGVTFHLAPLDVALGAFAETELDPIIITLTGFQEDGGMISDDIRFRAAGPALGPGLDRLGPPGDLRLTDDPGLENIELIAVPEPTGRALAFLAAGLDVTAPTGPRE